MRNDPRRDLSVTGKLDDTMGGPSATVPLSPGIHVTPLVEYQKFDLDSPAAHRRSVYRFVFRTLPDPFYERSTADSRNSRRFGRPR